MYEDRLAQRTGSNAWDICRVREVKSQRILMFRLIGEKYYLVWDGQVDAPDRRPVVAVGTRTRSD